MIGSVILKMLLKVLKKILVNQPNLAIGDKMVTLFQIWKLDHGLSLKASQGSLEAIKPAKNLPAMDCIISMVS
tara:strand:- start:1471 stop:1689 length:219 start_codon:yes stop_codon:yes gene_type:complete